MREIMLKVRLSDKLWKDICALADEMQTEPIRLASFLMSVGLQSHMRDSLCKMGGERRLGG